jgi:K+-transporting ATPase KdpF subunit
MAHYRLGAPVRAVREGSEGLGMAMYLIGGILALGLLVYLMLALLKPEWF